MRISDWSSDVCSSDLLNMASNCSLPVAKTMSSAKHSDHDIAQAARFTLLSINQHRSIGQLALRYAHVGDAHSKHIAYATGKKCVYEIGRAAGRERVGAYG